jgi:Anthrone oxygenase
MLIGVSFLSFWKSLSPAEFQAWFASYSHLIGRVMIPLGIGGPLVTVAAVAASWRDSPAGRRWLLIAVVSAFGVIVTYPLFFQATNEKFVRAGLSDEAARALLDRWATRDWIRTGLGSVWFPSRHYELFMVESNRIREGCVFAPPSQKLKLTENR